MDNRVILRFVALYNNQRARGKCGYYLSGYRARHPLIGANYGAQIADGPLAGLLSRAIVVIDESGNVAYTEQVPEITQEPNYDAALAAL